MTISGSIRDRGRYMRLDEVEVWVSRPDMTSGAHIAAFESVLNDAERARAGRFHLVQDQQSYICAHALTRCALAAVSGGSARDFTFRTERYGKPELDGQPEQGRLRFNLSHARGLVCCAIARERDVGIDVEGGARDLDVHGLARQVFAEDEVAFLGQLKGAACRDAFLSIWTLKEAYTKAVGRGLSIPLNGFSVCLAPLSLAIGKSLLDDPVAGKGADWHVRLARPRAGYRLGLAVRADGLDRVFCRFREVTPDALAALCNQPGLSARAALEASAI